MDVPSLVPRDHIRHETLERVRHFLSKPKLPVYPDLKGMCERVSDSYRERVVIELLQNAHDAHEAGRSDGRIKVVLDADDGPFGTLSVANDGNGFSEGNFDALCSPTRTTKNVNDAIGNKGVGFLSAFQVCAHPQVYSRVGPASTGFDGFCFEFADDATISAFLAEEDLGDQAALVIEKMPRLYLACPTGELPSVVARLEGEGFATVVRLPLKNAEALQSVRRQIGMLAAETPPVQLFLSRIAELAIETEPMPAEPLVLSRQCKTVFVSEGFRLLTASCGARSYVIAERRIPYDRVMEVIERDVQAEALPESWRDWTGDAIVSLAVAGDGAPLDPRLYNFLPMGADAKAPFAGYLDAPFYASIDRLTLQTGVELNRMFLGTARALALEGARAAKEALPVEQARTTILDFVLWKGEGASEIGDTLAASNEALFPAIATPRKPGWAGLKDIRHWRGDDFVTAHHAARVAPFPILDPAIGVPRISSLQFFAVGRKGVTCTAEQRAEVMEAISLDLAERGSAISKWDQFYRSLATLLKDDAKALPGRKLLLTARGEVEATEITVETRPGRRRRLSAIFLPPLRGAERHEALPRTVQRRLAYLDPMLEIARDGSSAARQFLLSARLVRDHESREILRLLAGAIAEPGDTRDPEALRWEALSAMMRIVTAEDMSASSVEEINPLVPTFHGWSRAGSAYFGAGWHETGGSGLQRLFDSARGISTELDQHSLRMLRPYGDWQVGSGELRAWVDFLRKAGVRDVLRPVPAYSGPGPRVFPGQLAQELSRRAGLPEDQSAAWLTLMGSGGDVPNPQTPRTASEVMRLPGQLDFAALTPVVAELYASEIVRLLEARPELLSITIYKCEAHHNYAPDRRSWPSPIAAFVKSVRWLPLVSGEMAPIGEAWLPGADTRTPPPLLPIVAPSVRGLLARCEKAATALKNLGLAEYGTRASAWKFLKVAGDLINQGASATEAERILAAAQDAWQLVNLEFKPIAGLRLIGRRAGDIVAVSPSTIEGVPFLIADGDDRQMVAATARSDPSTVVIEPPTNRAREVAAFLSTHFPLRVRRASTITAVYESGGIRVAYNPADPLIEDALGDQIRQIVALTLRYRAKFYQGNREETLRRLSRLRFRILPELALRVGDFAEPVPRFAESGVLLRDDAGATIIVSSALAASDRLLVGIAEAVGTALGSHSTIGVPLLAFVAQLGADPLARTYQDYAQVLDVPVEDVRGVLGAARASVGTLLRTIRPFIFVYAGETAAASFVPGAGLMTDEDVIRAVDALGLSLPTTSAELVKLCREAGNLQGVALALRVDLAALNGAIGALGPPYVPIDLTERHQGALAGFLMRKEPLLRESIRQTFRPAFAAGADLAAYVAARDAPRPALPEGFGLNAIELSNAEMVGWLDGWMAIHGIEAVTSLPAQRNTVEAVREANLRQLRAWIPTARAAILARRPVDDPLRQKWASVSEAEAMLVTAAVSGGWADFDRLDEETAFAWMQRASLWPADWATNLRALALREDEREGVRKRDEDARIAATTIRQQIPYSGGTFTVGVDSMGSLADHIASLVAGNSSLLATSSRTMRGTAPVITTGSGGGGGGRGGGGPSRLSEAERNLIGFFGEAIAFDWLKRRFGAKRIVDESCWKSEYRRHLTGEPGNDGLGYDFAIGNGATTWYFEVKSTTEAEPRPNQSIELGSSQYDWAEQCRSDRHHRFRILYVMNALNPDKARIFQLPNPRSKEGLSFYGRPLTAGVRLVLPVLPRR